MRDRRDHGLMAPGARLDRPLAEIQQETWLAGQYGEDAALALASLTVVRLEGALDRSALERALGLLWRHHDALRISVASDGRSQRVHGPDPLPLAYQDVSAQGDAEAALAACCEARLRTPFEPVLPPLVRLELIGLGEHRHALLLHAHKLVLDRPATARFLAELAQAYNALVAGRAPDLPPAMRPPAAAALPEAALDYWRTCYARLPEPVALPADHPAPSRPRFDARCARYLLPAPVAAGLRKLAHRLDLPLEALLLGGFAVLMMRLSGQRDFAVGVDLPGREGRVHALPVRLRAEPAQALSELLAQTARALREATVHGQLGRLRLLRELGLNRRDAEAALAGLCFEFDPGAPLPCFDHLDCRVHDGGRVALLGELLARVAVRGPQLEVELHGAAARFDAATLQRWAGHYATLLAAVADASGNDVALAELPLLDAAGRRQLLHDWNATSRAYDRTQGLTPMLEEQMRRTPRRIAAECAGEWLDYAALEARSRALAQALVRRGVGRGDCVGVHVPRSLDMLVAVLGILRSGAAYVPLDPQFPQERLDDMAMQADLRHLLVAPAQPPSPALAAGRDCLVVGALAAEPLDDTPLPAVHGEDLAYVLFTSGSTGRPKGVRILHRNLVNFLQSMRDEPGFGADDALCMATTLSFDIAGLELYLPLLTGGRLVIATAAEHGDPVALFELIERSGCNVFQTTPSLLQLLHGLGRAEVVRRLRLFVGGEAMPLSLARALAGRCRELWNLYGPTETTIWSTAVRIDPGMESVPLGRPIANTRIYVLDERRQPVPPGVLGEIWIAGDGVADGYLGRPDLTAERFVDDPFAGGRMYRTGDRGTWRDGLLYFGGRADDQIKIRGYRIEPGDIQAVAAAEPGVRECVAVALAFGDNDVRLVLYVAGAMDDALAGRLRMRLQRQLPGYMQPQHIEWLAALPKTPNGKIDRKALPRPAAVASNGVASADVLTDPRERYLSAVWRELIGVEHVRAQDSFFDLGGHSLLAVEFAARVQRETGVRLRLLDVASGTLAMLASELPAQATGASGSLLLRLRRRLGWN
jgi:amino acid adenylation domain-containing protein